jgi:hypothetical protein
MPVGSLPLAFSTDGGPGGPGFRGSSIPPIKIYLVPAESSPGASFVGTFGQMKVTGMTVDDTHFRGIAFHDDSKTQIAAAWIAPDRIGRKRLFINDGLDCYPIDVSPDLDPGVIASITELGGWLDRHREEYSSTNSIYR